MANQFYVQPGGDYSAGLAGLSETIRQIGTQKRMEKKFNDARTALTSAMQSEDPDALHQALIDYPELNAVTTSLIGLKNEQTETALKSGLRSYLANPTDEAIVGTIQEIDSLGGRPDSQVSLLGLHNRDPEAARKQAEMMYSSLANKQEWEAYKGEAADKTKIGTYNPRDYTTASFSKFMESGDPGVLERYAPTQSVMIGGVPHVYDPVSGDYRPTQITAADVAEDKAGIAAAVVTAQNEAKAAVDKQISQQGQMSKLDDADRVYKALSEADLDLIYGKGESWLPDYFRSQAGLDLLARKAQLVGMLKLAARGELKGQGPITEGEQSILSEATTVLDNPEISPDMAKEALDSAMSILYRNAGKEFVPPKQDTQSLVDKYAD